MRAISILAMILMTCLLLVCLTSTVTSGNLSISRSVEVEDNGTGNAETRIKYGVVYLSRHNHYELEHLPDEMLNRDFARFREQGLEYITLIAVWKYLQPTNATYNEDGINELIRVCSFAKKYDLKVTIDFHTMMSNNSWTMPDWLPERWFNSVFAEPYQTTWLNFLDHVAERLNAIDNIRGWNMMNEPSLKTATSGDWGCDVSVNEFIQLWSDMKDVFRKYSNRPVSVRFAAEIFNDPNHFDRFHSNSSIYNILDYIALNWYEKYCTRQLLQDVVSELQQHTEVMISEFGLDTSEKWGVNYSDEQQAQNFIQYICLFNSLNINECVAWMWRTDGDTGNYSIYSEGLNLAKDIYGTPRKAFFTMSNRELHLVHVGVNGDIFWGTVNVSDSSFRGWTMLPGKTNLSVATSTSGDMFYLVHVGMTGDMFWGCVNVSDSSFSGWNTLSGKTDLAVSAVLVGNALCIVHVGLTRDMFWGSVNLTDSSFSGWTILPGKTNISVKASARVGVSNSELNLVHVGVNDDMFWGCVNVSDSSFSGWNILPGKTSLSAASAIYGAYGNFSYVAHVGMHSDMFWGSVNLTDSSFSSWAVLPGMTELSVGISAFSGELYFAHVGFTGDMFWGSVDLSDSSFTGWTMLPGKTDLSISIA